MTDDIARVTSPLRLGEDRFAFDVADGWQQGRGAFGGLVLGAMARALEQHLARPGWALRALNAEIFAPVVAGPAAIEIETLRTGTGVATLSARLAQEGEARARATAAFGKQRVTDRESVFLEAPSMPPFEDVEVAPIRSPIGPAFAQHLEYRPISSPWNRGHQRVEGFIRFREASRGIGAPEIVALCDSYYPAAWGTEPAPRPMSTLAFTIEIVSELAGLGATDPYFYRAHVAASHDGFSVEFRELWDARGRLLALNQQVFVYLK
jgi:acyl-CoA thioesterase